MEQAQKTNDRRRGHSRANSLKRENGGNFCIPTKPEMPSKPRGLFHAHVDGKGRCESSERIHSSPQRCLSLKKL
jgi:hypothetical protein